STGSRSARVYALPRRQRARRDRASALVPPERLGAAVLSREAARDDEQEIGQPVQIRQRRVRDGVLACRRPRTALGAACNSACDMTERGGAVAARQDELAQRRQGRVEAIELRFEPRDVG